MKRLPEFIKHERFTAFHAALLVFAMDSTGYFLVRGAANDGGWSEVLWIPFLALTAYGWWLLVLQRRTGRNYLLFGTLLAAVNLGWALQLTVWPSTVGALRTGFLGTAGALVGLGAVVIVQAVWTARRRRKALARRRGSTSCTSGPA